MPLTTRAKVYKNEHFNQLDALVPEIKLEQLKEMTRESVESIHDGVKRRSKSKDAAKASKIPKVSLIDNLLLVFKN